MLFIVIATTDGEAAHGCVRFSFLSAHTRTSSMSIKKSSDKYCQNYFKYKRSDDICVKRWQRISVFTFCQVSFELATSCMSSLTHIWTTSTIISFIISLSNSNKSQKRDCMGKCTEKSWFRLIFSLRFQVAAPEVEVINLFGTYHYDSRYQPVSSGSDGASRGRQRVREKWINYDCKIIALSSDFSSIVTRISEISFFFPDALRSFFSEKKKKEWTRKNQPNIFLLKLIRLWENNWTSAETRTKKSFKSLVMSQELWKKKWGRKGGRRIRMLTWFMRYNAQDSPTPFYFVGGGGVRSRRMFCNFQHFDLKHLGIFYFREVITLFSQEF